jgi:hypothetical protein
MSKVTDAIAIQLELELARKIVDTLPSVNASYVQTLEHYSTQLTRIIACRKALSRYEDTPQNDSAVKEIDLLIAKVVSKFA